MFERGKAEATLGDGQATHTNELADRAERKLRRAIFAALQPELLVPIPERYKEGEEVVWLQTRGAGGSYRPNEKEPLICGVVVDRGRKVLVLPREGWRQREGRASWVRRQSVLPKDHPLAQRYLAARKYVI